MFSKQNVSLLSHTSVMSYSCCLPARMVIFKAFAFVCVSHKVFKCKDFDTLLKAVVIPPDSSSYLLRALSYQYTGFLASVTFRNQTLNPWSMLVN